VIATIGFVVHDTNFTNEMTPTDTPRQRPQFTTKLIALTKTTSSSLTPQPMALHAPRTLSQLTLTLTTMTNFAASEAASTLDNCGATPVCCSNRLSLVRDEAKFPQTLWKSESMILMLLVVCNRGTPQQQSERASEQRRSWFSGVCRRQYGNNCARRIDPPTHVSCIH